MARHGGNVRDAVVAGIALLAVGVFAVLSLQGSPSRDDTTPTGPTIPTGPDAVPHPAPHVSTPTGDSLPIPTDLLDDSSACGPADRAQRLVILSFNVRRGEGPPGALDRLAEEIRETDPDVVLLQEVDRFHPRSGGVDQAEALASQVGMTGSYSANLVDGSSQYGTLILTRHRILAEGRTPLPGIRAGREPRALQWVTLRVGRRQISVYNTHLEAVRPRVRLRQARHALRDLRRDTRPLVFGGDLNSWPTSSLVRDVSGHLTDTWTAGRGHGATTARGRRIDYLFTSGHFKPLQTRVLPSAVSDHHRVVTEVRLRARSACRLPRP